jgi:ribonuclease HI
MTYPIEIYTDGSKDGSMVGAGAAIYSNKQLIKQCKYKLCSYYPTNKAEQIAILKALEQLQEMEIPTGGKAAIYTDSKATTDSLKNHSSSGCSSSGQICKIWKKQPPPRPPT